MIKKIAYVTGTRADYGLMKNILKNISKDPQFELLLFPIGMHLLKEFGNTINEIEKDLKSTEIIKLTYEKDSRLSMALFTGQSIIDISKVFEKHKPDLLLALGDRGEQLATVISAIYLDIPVIHFHGGDISGTVDHPIRQAISQLANFHFTASKKSALNLISKGIDKNRIFIVGAPGLDEIKLLPKAATRKKQIVVLQHPAEKEKEAGKQIEITLKAVLEFELPVYIIFPNADAGGREIIKTIKDFSQKYPTIKTFPSLPRRDFLNLLNRSSALVGNSSMGIIEAPSFGLPTVNIGERQKGRERARNVIDVRYNKKEIKKAIEKCLYDESFKKFVSEVKNPYGDGNSTKKSLKIIKELIKNEQI